MTRACIYARVSTEKQDYDRQLSELVLAAENAGWVVVGIIGGKSSGQENDSDLSELQRRAARREFDRLMVWELSRLSRRGPGALLNLLTQFESQGVQVWSRTETWLNVEGPQRDLLIAIFGWVARWERDAISARTKSAMASRKALGQHMGRPKGSKDRKPRRSPRRGPFLRVPLRPPD